MASNFRAFARGFTMAAGLLCSTMAIAGTLTPIAPFADPLSTGTALLGINNAGWTTGSVNYADGVASAFIRAPDGTYTIFDNAAYPAGTFNQGRGISNNNTVVGYSSVPGGPATAFRSFQRTDDGTVSLLLRPSDGLALAGITQGINDSGVIVGNFRARVGGVGPVRNHGYILDGSNFTDFTDPTNATASVNFRGITNSGTVVGFQFDTVNGTRGLIYDGGVASYFAHPLDADPDGFHTTVFSGINNNNQIIGNYSRFVDPLTSYSTAFVYDTLTHAFTDVVVPGALSVQSFGINDSGQYVVSSDAGQFIYSPDGPVAPDGSSVFLPVSGGDLPPGQAQFAITVAPGTTYYIDPAYASGYEYLSGTGPLFASVIAPAGLFPSNIYELWLWNGASYAFDTAISGGVEFTFASALDRFQLRGIPESAGIDPYGHGGFITGLTFASAGNFDGFQIALVAGVPEPANWALLIAGFGLVGAVQRRRRAVVAA